MSLATNVSILVPELTTQWIATGKDYGGIRSFACEDL